MWSEGGSVTAVDWLHLVPSAKKEAGGVATVVELLAETQRARGCRVRVLALDEFVDASAPWTSRRPWVKYGRSARFDAECGDAVRCAERVVIHGLWQFHGVSGARHCRREGRPYLVFPHGMLDPWFHRGHPLKRLKKIAYWLGWERQVLAGAKSVVFTASEEAEAAKRSLPGWPSVRERIIPLGVSAVPTAGDAVFRQLYPQVGRRFWLFLGRLHPKKNPVMTVQAYGDWRRRHVSGEELPDLVIAGPDPDHLGAIVRVEAERQGVAKHVWIVGSLQDEAKWSAFRGAEAFVLFSHQENFGMAVAESLACGTPVMISRGVNIWREVQEAGAGLTCETTSQGVADCLDRWVAMSADERAGMRQRAEVLAKKQFDIRRTAEQLEGIFL
jgi:glycosyltransferase involved in cell wall biosynthesis